MYNLDRVVFLLVALVIAYGHSQASAQGECEPWQILGGSMNADVRGLVVFDDGNGQALYAGGEFTLADGVAANRIARWDGSAWHPLGEGLNGAVLAMTVYDDGSGPALYVGGSFTRAGGTIANRVARWDGVAWSPLGTGVNNTVNALCVYDDGGGPALYAGGEFTTAGGVSANRIARWDGDAWSPLGIGVDGGVTTMAVYDDGSGEALYIAGEFRQAGGVLANSIARWDGMQWSGLGSGLDCMYCDKGNMAVFDIGSGPKLFIAASFVGCGYDCYLSAWDGTRWSSGYVPGLYGSVLALGVHDGPRGQQLLISSEGVSGCEFEDPSSGRSEIICHDPGVVALQRRDPRAFTPAVNDLGHRLAIPRNANAFAQVQAPGGYEVVGAFGNSVLQRTKRCIDLFINGDVVMSSCSGYYPYCDGDGDGYTGVLFQPRRSVATGLTSAGFGDMRAVGSWEVDVALTLGDQATNLDIRSFLTGEVRSSDPTYPMHLDLRGNSWGMYLTIDEPLDFALENDQSNVEVEIRRFDGGGAILGSRLDPGIYRIVLSDYSLFLYVESGVMEGSKNLAFDLTLTRPDPCPADLDGDGELTIFDFLEFQNLFDAGDPRADFDGDGELTLFDFLAFQNAFAAGCP